MKYISTLIILILFSTILNAEYVRTIRVGSFVTEKEAQESLLKLQEYFKKHNNISKLHKKHKFKLKARKSGKYYATLIEPLTDKTVLQEVLDTLRLEYKDVYVTKLIIKPTAKKKIKTSPKPIVIKERIVPPSIEIKKVQKKTEVVTPAVTKPVIEVKPKVIEDKKIQSKKDNSSKLQGEIYLWMMLFFIAIIIILFLIIKLFKSKKEKKLYIHNELQHNEKLEQIKKKDMFLAHTSNELKTSITAIKDLSKHVLESDISTMQKDTIHRVNSSASNSIKSIDDILNISKIQKGEFEIKKHEFNINDVIDYVLTITIMQARSKNIKISLESEIPSLVIGDSFRLAQVLTNILSNSILHTKDEEIILSIMQVSRYKDRVKLAFHISDIGMTKEEVETLFKDDSTANELNISKQLIEMMDGEIIIDEKTDTKTSFTFNIVMKLADENSKRQYRLPSSSYLNKKVLVVDSNSKNVLALKKRLAYFKYDVDSINSFEDKNFKYTNIYDLIVLNQSKLSSFSIRKIKEMQKNGSKIVILSELCSKISDSFLYNINIDASLKIPFTQQSILEMIIELDLSKDLNNKSKETELKEKLKKLAGKKILVADDNELNHEIIKDFLSSTGIELSFVLNGVDAIKLTMKDEKFDLILMDINMPKLNGYEAAKKIRKNKIYNNVKILALLSDDMDNAIEKAFSCGMQGNISKPIVVDTFCDEVLQALNSEKEVLNATPLSQSEEDSTGEEFDELATSIGLKKFRKNRAKYKSALMDFKAMHVNSSSVVEQLCKDEYFKEAISLIVEVKGIALSIGAYNLFESATVMEYELSKGVNSDWKKFINYYNRSISKVFKNIDDYLKKVSV